MSARAARRLDPEPEAPTPESFLEEIRAIINSGTLRGAREVAERGLALYPDHPELKRLHHAFRPYTVRSVSGHPRSRIAAKLSSGSSKTRRSTEDNGSPFWEPT